MTENRVEVAIIGGSGLYALAGLETPREVRVETPFGPHSEPLLVGTLEGRATAFLARHGREHRRLAKNRSELLRQRGLLDAEADQARVPMTWR